MSIAAHLYEAAALSERIAGNGLKFGSRMCSENEHILSTLRESENVEIYNWLALAYAYL